MNQNVYYVISRLYEVERKISRVFPDMNKNVFLFCWNFACYWNSHSERGRGHFGPVSRWARRGLGIGMVTTIWEFPHSAQLRQRTKTDKSKHGKIRFVYIHLSTGILLSVYVTMLIASSLAFVATHYYVLYCTKSCTHTLIKIVYWEN